MNVTLHYFDIEKVQSSSRDLVAALPRAEGLRAQQFFHDADRLRFCIGRLLLRKVLSMHTGQAPRNIAINTGPQGKPHADCGPSFNLSHSGSAVLVGFAETGDLGVDIEFVKPLSDLDQLASHCFSDCELEALEARTGLEKTLSFFRAWTRKEAFVKALGGGLNIDLKSFSVSMNDVTGNTLLDASACGLAADDWTIQPVPLPGEFLAAVAWNYCDFTLETIECEPAFIET